MKNIKFVLLGILSLGILGAIFKPKTKVVETEKSIVVTEKIEPQKLAIDLDHSEFWDEFDPMVKERVYKMIDDKDCNGLQQEFDAADENIKRFHAAGRNSYKHSELLSFVDEQMRDLNCYK